jgi:glycosyltransferase involved in cell wall biosynthesis
MRWGNSSCKSKYKDEGQRKMLNISIVTSSFNQAKYLEECLNSVKDQDYPSIEHIVIDGQSDDGSVEILREYAAKPGWSHLHWISEPDRGQSEALNKGFLRAQGDIIGWLNSDDFYLKGCFQYVAEAFQREPRPDAVYGDYIWVNEINGTYQVRREIPFNRFVLFHNHVPFIQSSGGFFVARKVIDDGHLLDLNYHNCLDYEYFLRLYRGSYRFCHSPHLLGALRLHGSCKSATHGDRAIAERERARRENLKELGMLPSGKSQELHLTLLRSVAACRRWAEKAIKGYYFGQFHRQEFRAISKRARV